MSRLVVLSGINCTGKTTLGKFLEKKGFRFEPQMGEVVSKKFDRGAGIFAREGFDKLVMEYEFKRDSKLLKAKEPIVVESWHPDNIAHARIRAPGVAKIYAQRFREQVRLFDVLVIYLDLDPKIIFSRTTYLPNLRERVLTFYKKLRINIISILEEFSLERKVIDSSKPLSQVKKEVLGIVKEL